MAGNDESKPGARMGDFQRALSDALTARQLALKTMKGELRSQRFLRAKSALDDAIAIILAEWAKEIPTQSREYVTGIGTHSRSNFGNSGFSGGCTKAAA